MSRLKETWRKLRQLFGREQLDHELAEEIRLHLELRERAERAGGLPGGDAARAARRKFGNATAVREQSAEAWGWVRLEQLLQDVRYGARALRRAPGFTLVAVITLALGIGANTAIFSVVSAVLLRPLAYQDPDRLVTILHTGANPVAPANYLDWRAQGRSFEAMEGAEYWSANLTGAQEPEHLIGLRVTQNLLPMLGIGPLAGRLFATGEDRKGAEHEVVLSYRLWERRFNKDRRVVGRPVRLNGDPYVVVGIMPPGFRFAPFWATKAEFWAPLALGDRVQDRDGRSMRVFAKLKSGTTLQQARAEMTAITARLDKAYPATNRDVVVTPLRENVVGKIREPLVMVLGAVCFVLLIACANVAHMLLARTADREKEIAVRTALGAARGRVVTQFLTENLLLAGLGGGFGLLLAVEGTRALVAIGPSYIPRIETVSVDGPVLLFLLAITGLTGMFFGLLPALHAAAGNLSGALKEGGRGDSNGLRQSRARSFLVASEFALAFVLLIGAGLMIRSFFALVSSDPGFKPQNVLSMIVSVAGSKESEPGPREVLYRELMRALRALPGVQAAGAINHLPLAGDLWGRNFAIEGRPKPKPGEEPGAVYRVVMPGYFETMRLPLIQGRTIGEQDDKRAPGVVVINQQAAREYWSGRNPLGQRIRLDGGDWLTVIGIAKDAKQGDWADKPYPEIYLAGLQTAEFLGREDSRTSSLTLVVRTPGDLGPAAAAVRRAVWSLDRNLAISDVLTMERAVADANAAVRFEMLVLGIFGGVALFLAGVGIYGVMSYAVARRTREIGIRLALGARRGEVVRMVMRQGMGQALAGGAAGTAAALLLARLMQNMLYGVRPHDPATFGTAALVLGAAALGASLIPARRASTIDPVTALRSE